MTEQPRPTRRHLLGYAGAGGLGLVTGGLAAARFADAGDTGPEASATVPTTISPYGAHQPGVTARTPRATTVVALDVRPGTDKAALGRLMRQWSGTIAAVTMGRPAPGDTAPDLAQASVDLTVTVGWGRSLFATAGLTDVMPPALTAVPAFDHDALQDRWSGGDLVVLVGADDATSVAHAVRRLLLDAAPFARLRWEQQGSWRGLDARQQPVTGRNLFGQVDGTANLHPDDPLFDATVWTKTPHWFAGGTTLVVRRIRMDLDTWDTLTRDEQEHAVGRDLAAGAPLTGTAETDEPDFAARDAEGRLVIPAHSHLRLGHPTTNGGARILRRGLNYTAYDADTGRTESGLVFCAFQADVGSQYTRIQRQLDGGDALNEWTTAIGSAEFAVLPGFSEDGYLGDRLLES